MVWQQDLRRTVVCVALFIALFCFSMSLWAKGPELLHSTSWIQGYFKIPFSIYAGAKDDSGVKRVTLCFRNNRKENFNRLSMIAHPEAVTQEGHTLYEATIPGSAVTTGLEYYIEAENTADQITRTSSYTAGVDFELELLPGIDAYPTLNRDKDHPDVRLLRRIPKLWGSIGSGADTSFGYDVPGQLWVPVELSEPGLRTLIELPPFHFDKEHEHERKEMYKEVLFHAFLQDGLANDSAKQEKAWEYLLEQLTIAGEAAGLGLDHIEAFIDTLGTTNRLTRDQIALFAKMLNAPHNYTGLAKKFADISKKIELVGLLLNLLNEGKEILGDGFKAMAYQALASCEAEQRIKAFGKSRFVTATADPALVKAYEEVVGEIETLDASIGLAVKKAISDEHAFNLVSIATSAAGVASIVAPHVSIFLTLALTSAKTVWFDVFKEADLLKLLIATATLEKSMYDHAVVNADKKDLDLLLQMKYYLGYFYSRTHLLLEQKWTITRPHDFLNMFGLACLNQINDRFEYVKKLQDYCVSKYREPEIENIPDCLPHIETTCLSTTVLVIDTSGSMNWDDPSGVSKIGAARKAATEFVNMIDTENNKFGADHQVALVTFSSSASLLSPLTNDIETVRKRIAQLSTGGGTNMYEGLSLANKQLSNSIGEPIILLLSDGVPTAGPPNGGDYKQHEEEVLTGPVREAVGHGYCIYAVGFGKPGDIVSGDPSIDPDFLDDVVQATGCASNYYPATEASELLFTFVDMRQRSMRRKEVGRSKGTIQQGQLVDLGAISVPANQKALYANLTWPGSQLDLILEDPQGKAIDRGYPGATIDIYDNMAYTIVSDPLFGTWKASIYGRDIPSGSTKFAFLASVEPAEEPPPSQAIPERLIVTTHCPVDLAVKDPEGFVVNKQFRNIPETIYTEVDMNQDGDPDDQIIIPNRKVGDYQIRVIPEERAFPIDRYTLEVSDGFDTIVLADYARVGDIPEEPYVVKSSAAGISVAAESEVEPNVPTPAPTPTPSPKQGINLSMLIAIIAGAVALVAIGVGVFLFLRSRYYI